MDQNPHKTLHTAGIRDIATHLAETTGARHPLDPTMLAYPSYGPDARVDWLCASRQLLPVFHDVRVVDAQDLSDHNIVIARASRTQLAAMLCDPTLTAA
jgi:hypothetical protein